jgi:hypothetical protein
MIPWFAWTEPRRRAAHLAVLRDSGLPMIEVRSLRELNALNHAWGLDAPPARKLAR